MQYSGQKLADGKTIGGAGWLTDSHQISSGSWCKWQAAKANGKVILNACTPRLGVGAKGGTTFK
jgi:hypothetical protein